MFEIWRLISNGSEDFLRSVTELKDLIDRGDSLIPIVQGSRGRDGRGGREDDASMEDGRFESEATSSSALVDQPTCPRACLTTPIFMNLGDCGDLVLQHLRDDYTIRFKLSGTAVRLSMTNETISDSKSR
eukprot:3070860-Prymnesium_polylepis.1